MKTLGFCTHIDTHIYTFGSFILQTQGLLYKAAIQGDFIKPLGVEGVSRNCWGLHTQLHTHICTFLSFIPTYMGGILEAFMKGALQSPSYRVDITKTIEALTKRMLSGGLYTYIHTFWSFPTYKGMLHKAHLDFVKPTICKGFMGWVWGQFAKK